MERDFSFLETPEGRGLAGEKLRIGWGTLREWVCEE